MMLKGLNLLRLDQENVRDDDDADYNVNDKDNDDVDSQRSFSSTSLLDSGASDDVKDLGVTHLQKGTLEVQHLTEYESRHVKIWRRNVLLAVCLVGTLVTYVKLEEIDCAITYRLYNTHLYDYTLASAVARHIFSLRKKTFMDLKRK
jgi:hypothetical protein